jgi:hypothetical protein
MSVADGWEPMGGGTLTEVHRRGDVVRRSVEAWSPTVHELLRHLETRLDGCGCSATRMGSRTALA